MVVKRRSFTQARKAAGYTQEGLAEHLGVDRTTVARWESGKNEPHPWQRPKIADAFGLSLRECNQLLDDVGVTGRAVEVEILLSVGETLNGIERLRRGLNETITETTMTPVSLDDWEQTVFRHGQATRDRAPSVLLDDLSADLGELHGALARCRSSSALRRLTRFTAQMAGLMCLTLIKMDERAAFRGWSRTARLAADEAGDPLTYSWVRAQEAYGHYYSGDFTEAIYVAQHAQVLSGQISSVGFVLAAALEARAQAALGRNNEARTALHRAEACLSRLDVDGIGASAFNYNEAQLRFHEGNALTHLHDTDAAWQAQERALSLCPASDYMDRAMTWLDRAHCLAYDGNVTAAVVVMEETVTPLSDQQRQGIIALRVREIVSSLPPKHLALPAVQDLHDLLPPSPELEDKA
jgi:DNA-binding XRE family transcriptional regulator/tetratricopeptide (TPR) repeat protein